MNEEKCPQRCPYCGTKRGKGILHDERTMIPLPDIVWFECGTALAYPQLRGQECFKTEIAALKSLLRECEVILTKASKMSDQGAGPVYSDAMLVRGHAKILLSRIHEAVK